MGGGAVGGLMSFTTANPPGGDAVYFLDSASEYLIDSEGNTFIVRE